MRALVLLALLPSCAVPAQAQQFVTDDSAIVDFGACQLEGWHGQSASWILPACQLVRRLEITAGMGFVPENGGRSTEYVIQGKYLLRELSPGGAGIGLVAGLGFGPLSQVLGDGVAGLFAYVPSSVSLAGDALMLHGNLGWRFDRGANAEQVDDGRRHALTWAVRADVLLPVPDDRLTAIGELFGEDRSRPEYQLGVRAVAIPDRLLFDVSWGGHTESGMRGAGWIGIAWTPPPFF